MRKRSPSRTRRAKCLGCGAEFDTSHSQGKYCGETCRREGLRASWRRYSSRHTEERSQNSRAHYEANREAILARTTAYAKTEAGKQAARIAQGRRKHKHPEKVFARQIVRAAIEAGYLEKQPCRDCGAMKTEAHHEDYMDPLNVVWVCRKHHVAIHAQRKEANP